MNRRQTISDFTRFFFQILMLLFIYHPLLLRGCGSEEFNQHLMICLGDYYMNFLNPLSYPSSTSAPHASPTLLLSYLPYHLRTTPPHLLTSLPHHLDTPPFTPPHASCLPRAGFPNPQASDSLFGHSHRPNQTHPHQTNPRQTHP